MALPFRDQIKDPTPAELELIARYAMLPEDPRRERAFAAFAESGLPHRRMEAWRWTDFRAALPDLKSPSQTAITDPFEPVKACRILFENGAMTLPKKWPKGVRGFEKMDAQALGDAERMPLGALSAALSAQKGGPSSIMLEITEPVKTPLHFVFASTQAEASFSRVTILVRPGASVDILESHLGGAGFSSHLLDLAVQEGGEASRTLFQSGRSDEAQAITADVHLGAGAALTQTVLSLGAKVSRIEMRVAHEGQGARAEMNGAYLAGDGYHVDLTSHVHHGAQACITQQTTKGAVLDGGRAIFQGKFHVPRTVGQRTEAEMGHHALLLEDGAEVFAKPELEIYADDVECAHGNTCGALDADQIFYMRQRGIPDAQAKALLTEAFIADALETAHEATGDILRTLASDWLKAAV
ncbi:MAG: SufD family Fe-S cluster assembly protein [Pseudomonadota bacterium]